MGEVDVTNFPPLQITSLTGVEPVRIGQVAPAAVHIKELNHIDPISVESLRIDEVRNLDPVRVERFDVTYLPTVNLSLSRLPGVDLNVRRLPPVAVGVHQDFYLPSEYTVHAKLLGVEFLRLNIHGRTLVTPRDHARPERSRAHERSFADVSAIGNPAIPAKVVRRWTEVVAPPVARRPVGLIRRGAVAAPACRTPPPVPMQRRLERALFGPRRRATLTVGNPHFSYPVSAPPSRYSGDSSVSSGSD